MTTQTQNPAYRPAPPSAVPPRLFALGDPHLAFAVGKSMERFGPHWIGHAAKIRAGCQERLTPNDLLLIPGDLSWASRRRDAEPDLAFLAALPGIKVAIKGNHDFWWESGKRLDYPGILTPPLTLCGRRLGIAGTRGWQAPRAGSETEALDRRLLERERKRLRASLDAIADCAVKLAMLHYPPHPFLPELAAAGVAACIYGHIHLGSLPEDEVLALDGDLLEGVRCYCVACDRIGFVPREIPLAY